MSKRHQPPPSTHPWKTPSFRRHFLLEEARKEAKRRRERGEKHKEVARQSMRRRLGLPPDLPKMKPWDYAKGKVR